MKETKLKVKKVENELEALKLRKVRKGFGVINTKLNNQIHKKVEEINELQGKTGYDIYDYI